MNKITRSLITPVICLIFSGCSSSILTQRDALLAEVRQRNAPVGVTARMQNLQPLQADDLIALHKSKVPEQIMADYINLTRTSYILNLETINRLRRDGLSPQFIDYLLATPQLYPQVIHVVEHLPAPYPVFYPVYVKKKR